MESGEGQCAMKGFAFFYCNGNSQHLTSDSEVVFSSLLKQLVTQYFSKGSKQSVIDAIRTRFADGVTFSRAFVLSSLNWISEYFSDIYVVIDGVDECSDREAFCESLGSWVKISKLQVLVASRPELCFGEEGYSTSTTL